MKKALLALLSITLLLGFCGCSNGKSDENLIKTAVTESLQEILQDPMKLVSGNGEIVTEDGADAELWPIMNEMLKRTTFEVGAPTIDGDKASVEVKFSTYDMGKSFADMLDKFMEDVIAEASAGKSAEDLDLVAMMVEDWKVTLGQQQEAGQSKVTPFTLQLNKAEEGWKVEEYKTDKTFLDIISGGMFTAMEDQ